MAANNLDQIMDQHRLAGSLQKEGKLPLIEIHILRPTGGEMFNRGFNGRHKELTVGGVPRARFSSQCLKHPIRFEYETEDACRTRMLPEIIMKKVLERLPGEGISDEAHAVDLCSKIISGTTKDDKTGYNKMKQIAAFGENDIDMFVDAVIDVLKSGEEKIEDEVKAVQEKMKETADSRNIDEITALFGRMSTDTSLATVYSAVQMNHAYAINPLAGDYDDYTAVDDYMALSGIIFDNSDSDGDTKKSQTGFMDTSDIASNVYYQYASVTTRILFENLYRGHDISDETTENILARTKELALQFIRDFIFTLPGAKQNAMASRPVPSVVYITVGDKVYPMTLDSIFEKSVIGTGSESTADIGVRRMKKAIGDVMTGAFAINNYKGQYWLSNDYSAPDGVTSIAVNALESIM